MTKNLNKKDGVKTGFYFLIFLSILLTYFSCEQNIFQNRDSSNIKKLKELEKVYLKENSLTSIYNLKNEALKQKNNQYAGTAYYYLSLNLSKSDSMYSANRDSTIHTLQKAKQFFHKSGYSRGEMLTDYRMVKLLLWDNSYELAVNIMNPLLKESEDSNDYYIMGISYALLGHIYNLSEKPDNALQALDKASSILENHYTLFNKSLSEYNEILLYRAIAFQLKKDYSSSLTYCNLYRSNINNLNLTHQLNNEANFKIDYLIAFNLIELNEFKEALFIMNKLQAYLTEHPKLKSKYTNSSNFLFAKYYYKVHEYEKAGQYLNSISIVKNNENILTNYGQISQLKIDLLASQNNYKAAIYEKNKLIKYTDSINKTNVIRQISDLKILTDIEELITQNEEKELRISYIQLGIMSLSIICVLIFFSIYIIYRNSRKIKVKNEKIFDQYKSLDIYNSKISDFNQSALVTEQEDKELCLFRKTELFLQTSELFLDPTISREMLSAKLGTNREYLTQSIQDNVGKTFMEYIYDMRLDYSRRLLSYHSYLSIDEIYSMSGFNSKSTFYRLFKKKYGLTPKEIQDIANKPKQKELILNK